jgi:serine/threonine protein kinase
VLIDFSIAIVKDANETLYGLSRAAGSFDYMAPEQAVGYAEPSSDIYSLAKLTIEMLTGRRLSYLLPDASLDLPDRVRELLRSLDIRSRKRASTCSPAALEFDPRKGRAWRFLRPPARQRPGIRRSDPGRMRDRRAFGAKHPFQPLHTPFPTGAHLLQRESHLLGDLFQGEPAEVVHIHDAGRVRVLRFQPVHQNADFDDLLSLLN